MASRLHQSKYFILFVLVFAANKCLVAQHDPQQPFGGKLGKTLDDTRQWFPGKVKAPQGVPNVIWILLDDVGFGASGTFGGLIETPNMDYLAKNGLRYTNFHTCAICGPTRAALLTGRNHHSVAMGHHPELAIGAPGYSGEIPFEAGTVAEIFKENGYNTFAVGKWHSTVPAETSPAGPYNRWPTGRGFEHFYGFLGGQTDQWHPSLVEETNQVDIEPNAKHLNDLLTDKAITYIANQKSADADKPFFLYFAPGATHAPHQVYKEWIDKYKGKFDAGWDAYREEVFRRQQQMGLLPSNAKLPIRQPGVKAWNDLSADEKKVFSKFMEVYAGYLSFTDYEIGRLIDYLKQVDQLDNTLIFLMIGDNGASKEGTYTGAAGTGNSISADGPQGEGIKFLLSKYDLLGTAYTSPNYPLGWAQACNTPFRYWKSDANSEGGSHNPLIIFYPKGIKEKGGIRTQYGHVIDVLPTTLEITGATIPAAINGYEQRPLQGISLAYSLNDATAASRHTVQYYELHGGRAIYKDGWKAEVYHPRNIFGDSANADINFRAGSFDKDKWELYNINEDWNETNDVAAKYPEKLEALKLLFDSVALANNVYPLKNYREGLPKPIIKPVTVLYGESTARFRVNIGSGGFSVNSFIETDANTDGVIFSSGGIFGGFSLFIKNGKPIFLISDGITDSIFSAAQNIAAGKHSLILVFGAAVNNNRTVTLFVDDVKQAGGSVGSTGKSLSSAATDGISVGRDQNAATGKMYKSPNTFTGKISKVVIDQRNE